MAYLSDLSGGHLSISLVGTAHPTMGINSFHYAHVRFKSKNGNQKFGILHESVYTFSWH
jgi:hypothetical protein